MGGFVTLDLITRHPERFITATIGGAGLGTDGNDANG